MKKILASLVVGFCFTLLLGESGSANTVQMFLPEYIFSFEIFVTGRHGMYGTASHK